MDYAYIKDLPKPPVGMTGWPWTEKVLPLPDVMPDGSPWPRVSIVTPSYNQGQFLEETIRSVLLQGYPNLEYIIVDGGSTDGSEDTIRKYDPWLAYWVSEPDRGQSHAVNKGWQHATGDFFAYLNSDDLYLPEAIRRAVDAFRENPRSVMVYSDGLWIDETGRPLRLLQSGQLDARQLLTGTTRYIIPQPTAFIRRFAVQEVGGLDESLHMAMDLDLWLKLALRYSFSYIRGEPLAALRSHTTQKTQTRVLEDRICSLAALERALCDPQCPAGMTHKESKEYTRLCLDIAGIYLQEHRDFRRSGEYFMRAMKSQPLNALYQISYRAAILTYRAIAPLSIRNLVRRIRGAEHGV